MMTSMDLVLSSLQTAIRISGCILALATLVAGVWFCSSYIGRPLGAFLHQLGGRLSPEISTEREHNDDIRSTTRKLSFIAGSLGLFFCWVAVMGETTQFLAAAQKRVEMNLEWNMWTVAEILLKGSIEGLIILGILAGAVKVVGVIY
ncbi:hypothetical protein L228DRAFT_242697 [Xylona heveae TC161]|uniref:Uncharacterized protein n=1 Tax=Xylona heveae (strain CBS 132557 / TC161) TaxID=1328760 RepID=A0A165JHT9_XYLHT|nr:hypothetical protein L228DRAFT_242697 [Xylona heveae TC161]KZF26257.1 hypothetical protein L228DRAFT_242697 [Xylona heveae TC161]